MALLKAVMTNTPGTVRVVPAAVGTGALVVLGEFEHPDPVYPGSTVTYHAVRDLLYKRSAANPAQTAMFPDNITDMSKITIDDQT